MKPNNKKVAALNRFCINNCDTTKPDKAECKRLLKKYKGLVDQDGKNVGNSEAAEQCMNMIGNFSHVVRNMNFHKQRFYLLWLSYDLNQSFIRSREGDVAQIPGPSII
eukprot:263627_1